MTIGVIAKAETSPRLMNFEVRETGIVTIGAMIPINSLFDLLKFYLGF